MSLALASGAAASTSEPTTNLPSTSQPHELFLGEEEIFDVSLSEFYVFDKENAGAPALAQHLRLAAHGGSAVRGVTDSEIQFGISAPFTGPAKELGLNMKIGIEAAFNVANAKGGVYGRQLRLIAADDGYEPTRTVNQATSPAACPNGYLHASRCGSVSGAHHDKACGCTDRRRQGRCW